MVLAAYAGGVLGTFINVLMGIDKVDKYGLAKACDDLIVHGLVILGIWGLVAWIALSIPPA